MSVNRVETTGFIAVSGMDVGATANITVGQNNDMKIVLKNTCKGDIEIPIFQSNQTFSLGVNGYTHVCDDVVLNCGKTSVSIAFMAANGGIAYTIVQESDFRKSFIVPQVVGTMDFIVSNIVLHTKYTLTKNIATGTSVSITRNGEAGYTGNVIYEGDILVIAVTVPSTYNLDSFTVNGVSRTSPYTLTVTGNVTIVTNATMKQWRTVYSGSGITINSGNSYSLSGLRSDVPTKVAMTGVISSIYVSTMDCGDWTESVNVSTIWNSSTQYNTTTWKVETDGTSSAAGVNFNFNANATCTFSANTILVTANGSGGNTYGGCTGATGYFTIRSIEQYY